MKSTFRKRNLYYDGEWNKDKEKYEIEDNEERAVYEDALYDDS